MFYEEIAEDRPFLLRRFRLSKCPPTYRYFTSLPTSDLQPCVPKDQFRRASSGRLVCLTEICQTGNFNSMQTTLRFNEDLMRRIKAEAAQHGISLTRYIEVALRERLRRRRKSPREGPRKIKLPVSRARGGLARGIRDLKEARAITDDAEGARLLMRRH